MTTIGIEIEIVNDGTYTTQSIAAAMRAAGINAQSESYNHNVAAHWKIVTDGTPGMGTNGQTHGFEVVSPILDVNDGDACWNEIMAVCNVLNSLGIKVNKACGLHVHIYVRDMRPKNVAAFCAKYIRNEHFIDASMPKSRRKSNNSFCRSNIGTIPTDPDQYMAAVNGMISKLRAVSNFADLRRALHSTSGSRYVKLNMECFSRYGTIEIRHAAGTTNPEKICMWVRFLLSMLHEANQSAYVRSMSTYLLTPDRAWGSLWRLNDRPATMWLLKRMRSFMAQEGITTGIADTLQPMVA